MIWLITLIVVVSSSLLNTDKELLVEKETPLGRLSGFQFPLSPDNSRSAHIFLGIPFAKPPVGDLRFERPVEPEAWSDVLDATKFRLSCLQMSREAMPVLEEFGEDCLHVNIFTPSWDPPKGSAGFPVLFYVHGGGYRYGSAVGLGYEFWARHYVPRDIVVVTVQYRLGIFGFSTNGTGEFSGDYGLWDLQASLKFVSKHIHIFGGDAKHITVFGHSAGSMCTSYLTMSPHTSGLFSQAIEIGATPLNEFGASDDVIGETQKLSDTSGCASEIESKDCLKRKTADQLLDAADKAVELGLAITELKFVPRYTGNDFLSHSSFREAVKAAPPKPILYGMTLDEAAFTSLFGFKVAGNDFIIPREEFANFDESKFRSRVRHFLDMDLHLSANNSNNSDKITEEIAAYYLGDAFDGRRDNVFYLRQHARALSDFIFIVPLLMEARWKAHQNWPLFLYRFTHAIEDGYPEWMPPKMVAHCAELPFIIGLMRVYQTGNYSDTDKLIKKTLLDGIVNFIYSGNPSSDTLEWPSLSATSPTAHLLIDTDEISVQAESKEYERAIKFWERMSDEFNVTIIHEIDKKSRDIKDTKIEL